MHKDLYRTIMEITRSHDNGKFRRDQNLVPRDYKTLNAIDSRLRNFEKEPVMKTIKMDAPSWRTAVRIYCAVLQNPKAEQNAKDNAEKDLLELADAMDRINKENKS